MALESGAPIKVADYPDAFGGATWGSGGTLIFSSGRSLLRVSAGGGGAPEPLTAPSQGAAVQLSPRLLPGERAVIFTRRDESGPHRLVALDLATGEEETLLEDASDVFYTATGHLVFARAGTLMAVPFDTERLAIAGEAVALLEGVRDSPTIAADFALSATGTLVYVPAAPAASALVWVDRSGQVVERAIPDLALDPRPSLSPDGRQVAVRTGPVNDQAVWIYDLGGRPPILLADDGNYSWPVWSPDGSQVAFNSNRSGSWDLYTTPVDGSVGEPRPLRPITGGVFLWSQGELIAQRSPADASDIDIVAVPLDSNSDVRDVVATEDEEFHPALSPDGHWLAYVSTRTGLPEVLVKGYPDGVARRLSLNGGREPRWSADGRELFYLQGSAMMAVSVSTEGELSFEPPMQLFVATTQRILTGSQVSSYDVARDGRFLMIEPLDATGASIVVVQNWFEELKRRVPRD
jgi:serine/threonine-protein kinase